MSSSPPPKRQRLSSDTSHKHSFPVDPLTTYTGPCALIKQPVEITCFSYDKNRNLHHDASSMVLPLCLSPNSPNSIPLILAPNIFQSELIVEILLPATDRRGFRSWFRAL